MKVDVLRALQRGAMSSVGGLLKIPYGAFAEAAR